MTTRIYAVQAVRGDETCTLYRATDDPDAWLDLLRSLGWTLGEAYEYIGPVDG